MKTSTAKEWLSALPILIAGLLLFSGAASAATARAPQVALSGTSLQNFFNSAGQAIDVYNDQYDVQCWAVSASNNATFTIQMELAGNAASNSVGIYNCAGGASPTLFQVFPGSAGPGWFAVASFNVGAPGNLRVNLFDNNANFVSATNYTGVNSAGFGFYLQSPSNQVFYSEDTRNGAVAQALVYPGTGTSTGQWWLGFEDTPYNTGDKDFDDFVVFLESVYQPVPAVQMTWGALKSRFSN